MGSTWVTSRSGGDGVNGSSMTGGLPGVYGTVVQGTGSEPKPPLTSDGCFLGSSFMDISWLGMDGRGCGSSVGLRRAHGGFEVAQAVPVLGRGLGRAICQLVQRRGERNAARDAQDFLHREFLHASSLHCRLMTTAW